MRLRKGLLLFCLMLIGLPLSFEIQETRGLVGGAPCVFLYVYTSTGGGGVTFNKTAWPDSSHNWTMTMPSSSGFCYCGEGGQLPLNTPITITAFEPKGYPFIRWNTRAPVSGWGTIANSTSNPTHITVNGCYDFTIVAVFSGPSPALPAGFTVLLGLMTLTTTLAWGYRRLRRTTAKPPVKVHSPPRQ